MKTATLTPKMIRQRKALLVLPVFIFAFTTLFFWALGGGKGNTANAQATEKKGFNTRLPDAQLKDKGALTKMGYYDKAALDSDKLRQQMKSDPYYHPHGDTAGTHFPIAKPALLSNTGASDPSANAAKVYQKLAALQTAINKPAPVPATEKANPVSTIPAQPTGPPKTVAVAEDPELAQVNGLLEKILDIQHPERLKKGQSPQKPDSAAHRFRAIPAEIDGNQKITQGTVVRIRLLDTVTLDGQLIPKGTLLYGSGNLYNQRLTLNLKILHMGFNILPIDLTVFDMTDGLEGICVPEAITGDAVKDGAVSGVQGMEFMSLDPSLTTQLAGAGLNTAKGLFSKKVKRIKAKLKDGYPLLLRDNISFRALSQH